MSKITTPIGEIVDKYTICKLKSERTQIDNSKEINEYLSEIQTYEGIQPYVDMLYEINGKAWDSESEIKKENESIIGLEEVGRRAIKGREFNKIRVNIRNEINSKYGEGYIETKIDHGSEVYHSLIIFLSTVPERLNDNSETGLKKVITSLCEQNDNDYEIHFEIPYIYKVTNNPYIIPDWMYEYKLKYPHLKIFRPEDMGPATKFVPALLRIKNPETILLIVDDDLIYHPDMIKEHRRWQNEYPDKVIAYAGAGVKTPMYPGEHSLRDSWIACVTQVRETTSIQHYKSVSHKRKIFDDDFFKYYYGRTTCDDSLLSVYCMDKNITMLIVPYESENHLFETMELWNQNNRVETFPVLGNSSSAPQSGANHIGRINQPMGTGIRFFCPPSIGDRSWENGVDPPRPMGWSPERGYFYISDILPVVEDIEPLVIEESIPMVTEELEPPVIEESIPIVIEEPAPMVTEDPEPPVIEESIQPITPE